MRQLVVPMGVLISVFGLGGTIYFGSLTGAMAHGGAIEGALCVLFGVFGMYVAISALKYRVILEADRIRVIGALRNRELRRDHIAGRRHVSLNAGSGRWRLVPTPGSGSKLELSLFLETDKDFSTWILTLPDLDLDKKISEEREATDALNALKGRGYSVVRLRKFATWTNRGVFGLGLAMYLLPDPHNVLVWAAIAWPWVAVILVASFQPFYRFGGPRNSPLTDLSLSLFYPGLFLTLMALTSMSTVGWYGPLGLMVFGAATLTGVAIFVDPFLRRNRVTAVLLVLLCCAYGYGAGLEANALLDQSPASPFPTKVMSKRIGGGRSHSYNLRVSAWGPFQTSQEVMVPAWRYANTQVGDTVCILLRPGALRVSWYTLASCDR
jgi:hypothetical protein